MGSLHWLVSDAAHSYPEPWLAIKPENSRFGLIIALLGRNQLPPRPDRTLLNAEPQNLEQPKPPIHLGPAFLAPAAALVLWATFIWTRDQAWLKESGDTLPVIAGIPLAIWLGWPWRLAPSPKTLHSTWMTVAALLGILGVMLDITLVLTLGWLAAVWAWCQGVLDPNDRRKLLPLLAVAGQSFPWIIQDCAFVGWWFRLSGAWAASGIFRMLGFPVVREGTQFSIQGVPIGVEAACSGLNTLQSILLAGAMAAYLVFGPGKLFWVNLPLLIGLAWCANLLRILILSVAALTMGADVANGPFHQTSGWLVVFAMFLTCFPLFKLQKILL